jgi:exo-beta-1,3-glucanase (GH17 family)
VTLTFTYRTPEQVLTDLNLLKGVGFSEVRTYYPQYGGGQVDVAQVVNEAGLTLAIGLNIFDNDEWTQGNFDQFLVTAPSKCTVTSVLIGNENLPAKSAEVIKYLTLTKSSASLANLPRSTSQTIAFWQNLDKSDPLLELVTFIAVNVYPYWDWTKADSNNQPIDPNTGQSMSPAVGYDQFVKTVTELQTKFAPLPVVVTEGGWPTSFGAPSTNPVQFPIGIENAKAYSVLLGEFEQSSGVNIYYYSDFDPVNVNSVDTSSGFNYHFGVFDTAEQSKRIFA